MITCSTENKSFANFASSKCSTYLKKIIDCKKKSFTASCYLSETNDENNIHKIIAENIVMLRKKHSMSQLDLALSIGHRSATVISKAEIGREGKHFNIDQLYKIACVLDIPIEYFFTGLSYDPYNT